MITFVVVSHVNRDTLRATTHYEKDGRTLCGRKVGTIFQRWFGPLPGEPADRLGPVSCPKCIERKGRG